MTAPTQTQTAAAAYQQQTAATRAQLTAFIVALWASLGVYRNEQASRFAAEAIPVIEAAMAHMQSLTAAYLATVSGLHGGSFTPGSYSPLTISKARNGVDPVDVYTRPFEQVWRQLHDNAGKPGYVDKAIESGQARAVQAAVTDVQLAKTQTSQQIVSKDRTAIGYRRQLEGPHSCALCVVASTQLYHKKQLMAIHPACDCSVQPVYEDDRGEDYTLDDATLAAAHATVAAQFGSDSSAARQIRGALKDPVGKKQIRRPVFYSDVLITHNHGELGPILAVRGQRFTGPGDLAG